MVKQNVLEVAVDDECNRSLFFAPLQRRVRGRLDLNRIREPSAKSLLNKWPEVIPGQVLGIDVKTGRAYIREPLHDEANEVIADRIKKKRRLPPDREEFSAHVPTWLFHLKRAVDAGHATVIAGELPDVIDGEPETNFITGRRKSPDEAKIDALVSSVDKLVGVCATLLEKLSEGKA